MAPGLTEASVAEHGYVNVWVINEGTRKADDSGQTHGGRAAQAFRFEEPESNE